MEEKNLTGSESLHLIQQMIRVAKEEFYENGDGWLTWGWLLFGASVTSMALDWTKNWEYIGLVWLGMLGIGLLIMLGSYLTGKSRRLARGSAKTYVQEMLNRFSIGFFISLFVMIAATFMSQAGNPGFTFGYYYVLYAFWMFIHGSALRFKPLIMGALVNWIAAIAIFKIEVFMYDMLVSAVAVLVGYLIPGYMLRAKYRKAKKL